jgi:hypothetical protein
LHRRIIDGQNSARAGLAFLQSGTTRVGPAGSKRAESLKFYSLKGLRCKPQKKLARSCRGRAEST